jgi:pyruvate,water dikinase
MHVVPAPHRARNYIRWFEDLRLADRESVGGKCASLGELVTAGATVPTGFAVTIDAFGALLHNSPPAEYPGTMSRGTLADELEFLDASAGADIEDHATLAAVHRRAAELIARTPLPDGLAEQVAHAYQELCRREGTADVPVAVRSSAVAEDGETASFAGQQETFLWTVGASDVLARLRDCWASMFSPAAIAYRSRLSSDHAAAARRISVGVQAMVDAEVAGVVLTVSPRTGDRSRIGINASWGLGQSVVAGEVTPDEYWLSKVDLRELSRTVSSKLHECRPHPTGRGVVTVDVPEDRRDTACLSPEQLRAIAQLALAIERHMGGAPQDIEFAIVRATPSMPARLVVLQARPETTWRAREEEHKAQASTTAPSYLSVIQGLGAAHYQVGGAR